MVKEKEEIEEKKHNPNLVDFHISWFPKKMFNEWIKDCETSYEGIRWQKMWSDHLKSKTADIRDELIAIKTVNSFNKNKEEPQKKIKCLGSNRL